MAISKETIKHVAELSKLSFSDDEIASFTEQIDEIMTMTDSLNKVDTTGVKMTTNVIHDESRWREDKAEQPIARDEMLENAPVSENGYIKVPAMLKDGGDEA